MIGALTETVAICSFGVVAPRIAGMSPLIVWSF
jgi:hypothetical protein